VLNRKLPHILTYANSGTWRSIEGLVDESQRMVFETGKDFFIEDIKVKAFPISHDAEEPVGFSLYSGNGQISVLTDTGCLSEEIYAEIKGADLLIIEANHDVEMLKFGRYPWFVKQRVLGEKGHLSNVDAAEAICRLLTEKKKKRHVLLAHLSRENNFPEMAYQTIKNLLEEENHHMDSNLRLNIIARDEMSALYTV
jgi:phosphoribosyl 1,2-cyclic phosphodiesterase